MFYRVFTALAQYRADFTGKSLSDSQDQDVCNGLVSISKRTSNHSDRARSWVMPAFVSGGSIIIPE
jgi:hypothetical protein